MAEVRSRGDYDGADLYRELVEEGIASTPTAQLISFAFDEFLRLTKRIYIDHALGDPAPACALRISPQKQRLTFRILDDLSGLQLAQLNAELGPNLDLRFRDGQLEVFCPSVGD